MNLSIRDVKRLFTAGIKAEFERTHDPRLEDADAVCAAKNTTVANGGNMSHRSEARRRRNRSDA